MSWWRSIRIMRRGFWCITPGRSLAVLGAVFLCVTGAEAMYADMGHIGLKPIRIAWMAVVLPALFSISPARPPCS